RTNPDHGSSWCSGVGPCQRRAMRPCRPCSQEEERLTSLLHRMTDDCFYSWLGTSAAEPFRVFLFWGSRQLQRCSHPKSQSAGPAGPCQSMPAIRSFPLSRNRPSGGVGLEAFRNSVMFFRTLHLLAYLEEQRQEVTPLMENGRWLTKSKRWPTSAHSPGTGWA